MVPVSRLNALRRAALDALTACGRVLQNAQAPDEPPPQGERVARPTARFLSPAQITPAAREYFAHLYLPLHAFAAPADGVIVPPVIFDSEADGVRKLLREAARNGAKHALVGNIGHLSLALEAGLVPHGDFRLNVTSEETARALLSLGFADLLLSPELTLPQIRDMQGPFDAVVYGRVPLMLLEKCVGREVGDCTACAENKNTLTDRRGERFPVLREPPHRNILLNSRPTVMSDKKREMERAGLTAGHYLFTLETPDEVDAVLAAYKDGTPLDTPLRRI